MGYYLKPKDIEKIEKHYDKFFTELGAKPSDIVMHESVMGDLHIDIEHYLPTEKFPYNIIATVGMSAYKMKDAPYPNVELVMFLPKDWKFDMKSIHDDNWYWPIKALKTVARMPQEYDSFISYGHTISDEDFAPYADCTKMCCGLVTFPTWIDYKFFTLKYGLFPRKKVNFLCLNVITKEEFDKLQEMGAEAFIDKYLTDKDGNEDLVVRNER